MEIGKYSIV